jgi:hypothetical protein
VDVSSIGRWWSSDGSIEIDVVGLGGRTVVLAGSAKWSRTVTRSEMLRLVRQSEALPRRASSVHHALFARDRVEGIRAGEALTFTAEDLYAD